MNQLVRYEAARQALAECQRVDEVKDIRDKAEAMAAYARQAKDQEMIMWATEIKVRAERKCGEMLRQSAERGERATREANLSKSNDATSVPTLSEIGVTKDQSSRYQQLASMSDAHFETAVATARDTAGQVTTAFMLREAKAAKPHGKPKTGPKAEAMREELKTTPATSMLCTYVRLTITALNATADFTEEEQQAIQSLKTAIDRLSI